MGDINNYGTTNTYSNTIKYTGELHCSNTNRFFDTRRETILKSLPYHTMLTSSPNVRLISWSFRSQFIFAGRVPKNLTATATVENSTLGQRNPFSAPIAESQLSACMVKSQTSTAWSDFNFSTPWSDINFSAPWSDFNWIFFKIFQILSPSLLTWHHPHSSFFSCLGFIMTMVIVISFARERKQHQLTTHPNS